MGEAATLQHKNSGRFPVAGESMGSMKWEWLKRQYEDIKGHYKWAIITWLVAGSGFTWLVHFLQAALHANIAGWLALAAPIFSILAVGYLVFVSSRTTKAVSPTPSNSAMLPAPSQPSLRIPSPVDLRGEIQELYFYKPHAPLVSGKTFVVMKVRIVNHGPDEATITHVSLQAKLGDFQKNGEITNIPDSWRIKKKGTGELDLILPTYRETTIAPVLDNPPQKEIYKKGIPHEGWVAFECYDFNDIEFPNAQFDVHLKDSLGGSHLITRKSMVYIRKGQITVAGQPTLPAPSK
jgi:hypothetical protein